MATLAMEFFGTPLWLWATFLLVVLFLVLFDLGVLSRGDHEIGMAESLWLSAFYVAAGLAFGGWIWVSRGDTAALHYVTGFVLEKSLAMDNIFVIAMIFAYLGVPRAYQHRVLLYGILGVVILRGIMIGLGAAVVQRFDWVLLLFAAFLLVTGAKILMSRGESEHDIGSNPLLRTIRRVLPVSEKLHGHAFTAREGGRLVVTPLLVALIMVELADVIFAVDSIPAIFAITTDPFIVYTSNIFAILGLRALYFALAAMMHRFVYLKTAIALVLVFIGGKVIAAHLMGIEKVPAALSLGVTLTILGAGIALSFWKTRAAARPAGHPAE